MMLRLYTALLRLYPARFRAEFGDEMRATFAQTLSETRGAQRLYRWLIELHDLPLSAAREHLAERRQKELLMQTTLTSENPLTYRWCIAIISAILLVTVLCSILPFYVFGLHQQPTNAIIGGHFDPKMMAFYQTPIGSVMYVFGIIMYIATPVFLTAFVPMMLFSMARSWNTLTWRWQAYGVLLLAASTALVLFLYVGAGRLILTWFMD